MLWGVPKKRPTVERRLRKRFGVPEYPQNCRIIRARDDLTICENCGDHHEVFAICRTCYNRVKEETLKIMQAIKDQTNPFDPKEKDVHLRYQGEENQPKEDSETFRIIDIDKPRPAWFTQNLLTKAKRIASSNKSAILGNDTPIIESHKK